MLRLPDGLTAETFLARHWQKAPLFMPGALPRLHPSVTRNELAWLATLDDVESRIVFTIRSGARCRYEVRNGPFEDDFLAALPKRDWTLLVHDVEKHLPAMRALLAHVPFIPDWRIDDLMVSFAAPGGGVGPHRDHYDVFLCQGIGIRDWQITAEDPGVDRTASADLALLNEFDGQRHAAREGDVLYLPPGIPHWGTAQRACMTYSIGMRAPQYADLSAALPDNAAKNRFYADPDLALDEVSPGRISRRAIMRALDLLGLDAGAFDDVAEALGRYVTTPKVWLNPEPLSDDDAAEVLRRVRKGARLPVHGMARIAFDADRVFVNGRCHALGSATRPLIETICRTRRLSGPFGDDANLSSLLEWVLRCGAIEIPGNL